MTRQEGESAVYRLFAEDDVLLYVGVAGNVIRRLTQHAKCQPWWPSVKRHTETWYADRVTAEDAEREAIKAEGPLYNNHHSGLPAAAAGDSVADRIALRESSDRIYAEIEASTEDYHRTARELAEVREETIASVVQALKAGVRPTDVVAASPFTAAYVRSIARDHGIAPAKKGRSSKP